jgi:oligopeptide/dipeptide ABC transporter ATP-binding protein
MAAIERGKPIFEAEKLKIMFASDRGFIKAVEGIDFVIDEGECVAIVGESGCGKSVTALSMLRLLPSPPALYTAQKFRFSTRNGEADIFSMDEKALQKIRGDEMTMIYQDPTSALNPVLRIGEQLDEVFVHHRGMNKSQARTASIKLLQGVGLSDTGMRCRQFPHELSGGMKQRVLIAMATACKPRLMIADEPTTALDVTVQAQVLKLIGDLRRENNMAVLFITHDLGIVNAVSDRVYVMYCGRIMEEGRTDEVLKNPLHPYTKGLIASVPDMGERKERFVQIPGNVPHPLKKPPGCHFSDRCPVCMEICKKRMPPLVASGAARRLRCWKAEALR